MLEYLVPALAAFALLICLTNWRAGFMVCLIAGCLQDPIRKITPGEPIYITSLVFVFAAATFFGAYLQGKNLSGSAIHAWNRSLRTPLTLFFTLVVIQSCVTFIRFDSPILALIGLLAYGAPVPAVLLGYHFGRGAERVQNFIQIYLGINILMIAGVYLSYLGFDWQALRTVGENLLVYSQTTGEVTILKSGFYRAPEMAAWHAATSICLLVIAFLGIKGHRLRKVATGILVLFFWGGLLFTGRRKFIMEIYIFLSVYGLLLLSLRNRVSKAARTSFLLMIVVSGALIGYWTLVPDEFKEGLDPYYERGATAKLDSTNRASLMTIESFQWVLEQNGPWGSGAGTGSQGAQHFGGGSDVVGYSAEGGLAKVMAELGLPGLALLLWLLFGLGRYLWAIISYMSGTDIRRATLAYGLISIIIANVAVFVTAHQIFGDPLVLILLGFFIGFILAAPRMEKAAVPLDRLAAGSKQDRPWAAANAAKG